MTVEFAYINILFAQLPLLSFLFAPEISFVAEYRARGVRMKATSHIRRKKPILQAIFNFSFSRHFRDPLLRK